jgi:hypothetical protein
LRYFGCYINFLKQKLHTVDAVKVFPAAVYTVIVITEAIVGVTGIIELTTAYSKAEYNKYFCSVFLTSVSINQK